MGVSLLDFFDLRPLNTSQQAWNAFLKTFCKYSKDDIVRIYMNYFSLSLVAQLVITLLLYS